MTVVKMLVLQIFHLLELVETKKNQPIVQKIRGLLFELLDQSEQDV